MQESILNEMVKIHIQLFGSSNLLILVSYFSVCFDSCNLFFGIVSKSLPDMLVLSSAWDLSDV